jgi:hypothetical protein
VLVPLAFLSGLVKPVFVAAVVAYFLDGNRGFHVLRIAVLLLFGLIFCLTKPTHSGYFLWFFGDTPGAVLFVVGPSRESPLAVQICGRKLEFRGKSRTR